MSEDDRRDGESKSAEERRRELERRRRELERKFEASLSSEQQEQLERLLDQFMEAIGDEPGDGLDDGASVVVGLEPHEPESDDPRILEAIQAEAAAAQAEDAGGRDDEGEAAGLELGAGFISPDASERDLTDGVKAAVGPLLDRQKSDAEERRRATGRRSGSVEERVRAREDLRESVRGLRTFLTGMWNYAGERLRAGCRWWDQELPEPMKQWLNGGMVVAGATAFSLAPMVSLVVTVGVVALVTRRRRSMPRDTEGV